MTLRYRTIKITGTFCTTLVVHIQYTITHWDKAHLIREVNKSTTAGSFSYPRMKEVSERLSPEELEVQLLRDPRERTQASRAIMKKSSVEMIYIITIKPEACHKYISKTRFSCCNHRSIRWLYQNTKSVWITKLLSLEADSHKGTDRKKRSCDKKKTA